MLSIEALFALREFNHLGDQVLHKIDLRQRAAEGSAPPGAGSPNP